PPTSYLFPYTTLFRSRQVRIRYPWKAKREYILELQEGVFTGYFGEKSTAGQRKFAYDETENYGDINLNIIVPDSNKHYVLELLKDRKSTRLNSSHVKI